eukprot:4425689-Ditylum_brightwellii.AAC.1
MSVGQDGTTSDKNICCGQLLSDQCYKSGKKSHYMMLEYVEANMAAAYASHISCCCSVPFLQKCCALS